MASMGGMRGEEEWRKLGLDPRQWAYGQWWTAPAEGDPELILPQPAPPLWAESAKN